MHVETETNSVDVGTDDLDAFSDLFHGKEPAKPAEKVEEIVEEKIEDLEPEDKAEEDVVEKSEEDDDQLEDKDDKPKAKKPNRVQERINQLVTEREEARREKNELLKRLEALENKQKESPVKEVTTESGEDGSPQPTDKNPDGSDKYPLGEFDPAYIRDLARHTIDQEWKVKEQKQAEEQAKRQEQEARNALNKEWQEKLSSVQEQHEDFMEKTLELESTFEGLDPQYSDFLVQTVKSLEHGPEVLYYFANNISEAQKFVKMGPLAAALALGELNAMFKGTTRKEAKVSKAPPPPQINKGTKTRSMVTADTDDLDAFSNLFFKK